MSEAMSELVCPPGLSDRLDRVLPKLLDGVSRAEARRLIDAGAVFVGGRRCRVASRVVREGERLRIESPPAAATVALEILYEDDACIAIAKPAGMPAAPTRTAAAGTALEELAQKIRKRDGRRAELWLVHRLDRGTSGALLFARTRAAAARLDAAFRERRVEKEYLAWVSGVPAQHEGTIASALREEGRRSVVDAKGKPAETRWRVEERRTDRTLMRVFPTTGRMHQIRVHLESIGHPVIGDRLYGGPPAPRLMLHASRLIFPHPDNGRAIEVAAEPPW